MKIMNYLNLNDYPISISLNKDRSKEFTQIYHAHQGMELLYVHSGSGFVFVDGKIIEIKPGSLFCFRPFHMHSVKIDINNTPYVRSLFVFEPSILEKYLQPFQSLSTFFNKLRREPDYQFYFGQFQEEKLNNMLEDYSISISKANATEKLEMDAFLLILLVKLLKQSVSMELPDSRLLNSSIKTSSVAMILNWLEENFHQEFSLDKLSEAVYLSPNHVSYLFHKETGSRITDYLVARRIQEACLLLRTTSLTIQEIGYRVGVHNFSYFCKFFKEKTGVTPYKFRKVHTFQS